MRVQEQSTEGEGTMLPTTVDAVRALLKADPSLTPADRSQIVGTIRNHGRPVEAKPTNKRHGPHILTRAEVAKRFDRSLRFVDKLAAISAGLGHVPIRRVDISLADLPSDERLRVLTAHNTQRRKTTEEQVREELFATCPEEVVEELRKRLEAREVEADLPPPSAMYIGRYTARAKISEAKEPFLEAVIHEVKARRTYWPLSVRQLHYAMLNDPPLRHSGTPTSRYGNNRKSYKDLCDLCTRARLAGMIPWEAVADETRPVELWSCHETVAEYVAKQAPYMLGWYRRDLMQGQLKHVEIVCEKNTVAEIVRRVARDYCIPVTSGRGYASGARRSELAGIQLDGVDLSERTVRLMGKGRRERVVPLTISAATWIGRYIENERSQFPGSDAGALWLGQNGPLSANAISSIFYAQSRASGVEPVIRPHAIRRACATHMLSNGASPIEIQQLLGHTCLKHLSQYLAVSMVELKRAHDNSRLGA
jgi:hypothetical protein